VIRFSKERELNTGVNKPSFTGNPPGLIICSADVVSARGRFSMTAG
jgi:hypothetical protein